MLLCQPKICVAPPYMIFDQKLFQFSNKIKSEINVISLFESFKPINCVNPCFMEIG